MEKQCPILNISRPPVTVYKYPVISPHHFARMTYFGVWDILPRTFNKANFNIWIYNCGSIRLEKWM